MNTDNFYYWIKGFFDMRNPETLTAKEVQEIRATLESVTPPVQQTPPIYENPLIGDVPISDFSSFWGKKACGDNDGHMEFVALSC